MPKITFQSIVSGTGDGVRGIADIRGKQIIIDEPASLGGTDEGPNPVELVLAALGGCINVLINSLAEKYQVEVTSSRIVVEGDLDPDGFLEKNPAVLPGFQEIRYLIEIESPSSQEQIQKLIEHVERVCPVKDILRGVPTIPLHASIR